MVAWSNRLELNGGQMWGALILMVSAAAAPPVAAVEPYVPDRNEPVVDQTALAERDRARFPQQDWPYLYYFRTDTRPPKERELLEDSLPFVVCSLSSKIPLEHQLPVEVSDHLYRIDTRGLGWERQFHKVIIEHYPYFPLEIWHKKQHCAPLVIRADWFVANLLDPIETKDAQYQLLYSGKPPANVNDFKKFWGIGERKEYDFGFLEGKSGVKTKNDTRLLQSSATATRGYSWETFDSEKVAGAKDPLENPAARPPKHDATELIVGIVKSFNGESGTLQAYLLANGQGVRQEEAPAKIVKDEFDLRGPDIRNSIDCISCHTQAIKDVTLNEYEQHFLSGAEVATDFKTKEEIQRYYQSLDIAKDIRRNNEDYEDGIRLVNGLTAATNSRVYVFNVRQYDKDLTLEQAARELYLQPQELQDAIAYYSGTTKLSANLTSLAGGKPISRYRFIENHYLLQKAIAAYRAWRQN